MKRTSVVKEYCRTLTLTRGVKYRWFWAICDSRPTSTNISLSGRLHVPIVGPTGRSDWSVRLVGPTIVSCKRFVWPSDRRLKNQTCLISSDCRSDCRSVWTLRPTGRTDWPVGRPITLQRWRYYNQLTGHIDLIDIMWATVCPTGLSDWSDRQSDVAWVGPTGRSDDRTV